jgi:hypothetical protein
MKNTYFMAKRLMNEQQFANYIYKLVMESMEALSGYNFESSNNDDDENQNDDTKRRNNRRRQQVEAFFKQPGVNPAAYAYRLYGVKPVEGDDTNEMKNARSKFMKCLNHEKNEDGYEYAFTSAEINELFSMISGNEMKESKIKLSQADLKYMVNESVKRILKEHSFDPYDPEAKDWQTDLDWHSLRSGYLDGEDSLQSNNDAEYRAYLRKVGENPNSWGNMALDEPTNVRDDNGEMSMLAQGDPDDWRTKMARNKRDTLRKSRHAEWDIDDK